MLSRVGDFYKNSVAFTIWKNILSMCAENKKPNVFVLDWLPNIEMQSNWSPRILGFLLYLLNPLFYFLTNYKMEGKTKLAISMDDDRTIETGLCDFDTLVELLTKIRDLSFINVWKHYLNKMHITSIEAEDKELFDAAYEYVIKWRNGNLFH